MNAADTQPLPQWKLERYALGQVTEEERTLLERDPDLPAQLAALRESDAAVRVKWRRR